MQGSSPSSPAGPRLWRPAAQRNVRNSWSTINTQRTTWAAASARGLSAATALVNAYLSARYVVDMDFGELRAMDGIQAKAREKFFYRAEGSFEDLLRFYEEMVQCLSNMMKAKKSMRTYVKGSIKGPLIEFSDEQYFKEDMGDGNRIAVFSTLSLHTHEMLAEELVTMFLSEIRIKWLIVSEFYHALYSDVESSYLKKKISEEMLNKTFIEANSKVPELNSGEQAHHALLEKFQQRPVALIKREVLQVYLTAWLAEVNIRRNRVEETLKAVSEEIQCKFAI